MITIITQLAAFLNIAPKTAHDWICRLQIGDIKNRRTVLDENELAVLCAYHWLEYQTPVTRRDARNTVLQALHILRQDDSNKIFINLSIQKSGVIPSLDSAPNQGALVSNQGALVQNQCALSFPLSQRRDELRARPPFPKEK